MKSMFINNFREAVSWGGQKTTASACFFSSFERFQYNKSDLFESWIEMAEEVVWF